MLDVDPSPFDLLSMSSPFGQRVRLARTLWGWCEPLKRWVRITPTKEGVWRLEIGTAERAFEASSGAGGKDPKRVLWWEGDKGGNALVESSPFLSELVASGAPEWIVVDIGENGEKACSTQ